MTGTLKRETGLVGAVLLGLGSMLGSGVLVSIGLAEDMVGWWVLPAILLAAVVAGCNALSSAQLAASHAKAGGTYEYGYVFLSPAAGFTAGTMFLLAKSASAATAALAFAAYLDALIGADLPLVPVALTLVAALTALVLAGLRRANWLNAVIVLLVVAALGVFVALGSASQTADSSDLTQLSPPDFFHACALLFVAFTGYGRVATMAEEVRDPRRTIPPAILATIAVTTVLYLGVGHVLTLHTGPLTEAATPLEAASRAFGPEWLAIVISVAAMLAMIGVLLNLILGLSRVLLAMGRRGDAPALFGNLRGGEPVAAIVCIAVVVGGLCLLGDVRVAWTFSAVTVLVYYAITNAAALRLQGEERLFPRWIAWVGLAGCLGLAAFVPPFYWLWALFALGAAFGIRKVIRLRLIS